MSGKKARKARRERLRARPLPSIVYPLLVDDPAQARAALEQEQQLLRQVILKHGADDDIEDYREHKAKVEAAQAALDDCYELIALTALRPAAYEQLAAQHPPTAAQQAKDDKAWVNVDTFRPALLQACADSDMTAADWAAFLEENVSTGERQGLYVAALGINERDRFADPLVPKGWTATPS